ncbi:MAG: TetR family transcriptional regulator [Myxococcales bacterium]|nr:TetR family transcriptional regulator [Myxococcales bacterium]MCB9569643.1 TetR family transcriptional regulator [Myxococcales bacterium]MCB9706475.1 TetR family transcriptional regulator [Myxococcales bacterium]
MIIQREVRTDVMASETTSPNDDREAARLARKARRQASRRQAILDAARAVIIDEGLGFTMDRVAAAADVSKPALYYYFRSKEALIGALAIEVLRVEVETLGRAIVDASGGLEALAAMVRAKVELYRDDPDAFRILYLWAPMLGIEDSLRLTEVIPLNEVVTHSLEGKLSRDRRRGLIDPDADPHRLATLAWVTAQGIVSVAIGAGDPADSPYALEDLTEEACRVLLRAARA